MPNRMKKVKLTEEKLQLAIASAMKLSLACSSLCTMLQPSPGAAEFGFVPYLSDPCRIMGRYMGSKHERNKRTAIKKLPLFLPQKTRAVHRFIFLKSPNPHFLFPNLFPLPENTKAPQISPSSYLHYDSSAHASRDKHLMQYFSKLFLIAPFSGVFHSNKKITKYMWSKFEQLVN